MHLIEMRHPQLELRVVRALVGGIERQELAILIDREDLRFGRPLAKVGIGETQLGVGAVLALRIAIHQLSEVLA
jgi:hypothetical protein